MNVMKLDRNNRTMFKEQELNWLSVSFAFHVQIVVIYPIGFLQSFVDASSVKKFHHKCRKLKDNTVKLHQAELCLP